LAAYLKFEDEEGAKGLRGALFIVNARGEPVEFSFSRAATGASVLWRVGEARRKAVTALCKTLFQACSQKPQLLLCLAAEVPPSVFGEDLAVAIPVARLMVDGDGGVYGPQEQPEGIAGEAQLFWAGDPPAAGSPTRDLLGRLTTHNLLREPFQRAAAGIAEALDTP
jgi:hypothetical protein